MWVEMNGKDVMGAKSQLAGWFLGVGGNAGFTLFRTCANWNSRVIFLLGCYKIFYQFFWGTEFEIE